MKSFPAPMVVKHCSSCTARQQELNRLKSQVRKLEQELLFLHGPQKLAESSPDSICAACGHDHKKTITCHHRVPLRIRWKIPHAARTEVLGDDPETVNLCEKCHRFIEGVSSGSNTTKPLQPCSEPIGKAATVTWVRLMNEIRIFERIAENVTEDLMSVMQSQDEGPTQFGLKLQEAVGGKKA